jgi:hypothetical protein
MVPLPLLMIIMTSGRRKAIITAEDGAEGDQEGEGVVTMEVAGVVVMGLIMVMVAAMVMDMVAGVVTMKMRMNIMSLKNMPLQLVVSAVWCYMFMWALHAAPLMSCTGFTGRGRGRWTPFRARGRGRARGGYY